MRFDRRLALCTVVMFMLLCYAYVLSASCDETDPVASLVLEAQKQYFCSITSLDLRQTLTLNVNDELEAARGEDKAPSIEQNGRIVVEGAKYLSEVEVAPAHTIRSAFDGMSYQRAIGRVLTISSTPLDNPYSGWTVLTAPFCFAGRDATSIDGLRSAELWEGLLKKVVSVSEDTVLGYEGVLIKFASLDNPENTSEAFFAKDLSLLPVYVKLNFAGKGMIGEMAVLETKTVDANGVELVIPTRVRVKDYSADGKYVQELMLVADTTALAVNEPVDEGMFSLPREGMRIQYRDSGLVDPQ